MDETWVQRWRDEGLITHTQAEKMSADLAAKGVSSRKISTTLFLSALMNGAVIVLFTVVYGVSTNTHVTLLLWMFCTAPMVYVLRARSLTALLALLFYAWVALFVFRGLTVVDILPRLLDLPALMLASGVFVFAVGGAHYGLASLTKVARTLRIVGLQMVCLMLLLLSTPLAHPGAVTTIGSIGTSSQLTVGFIVVAVAAGVVLLWNMAQRAPEVTVVEGPVSLALLALAALYFFVPLSKDLYAHGFSLVMLAVSGTAVFVANQRKDVRLLRVAGPAAVLLFAVKYASLAWGELSLPIFCVGLALIVVVGVLVVEAMRRQMAAATKPAA